MSLARRVEVEGAGTGDVIADGRLAARSADCVEIAAGGGTAALTSNCRSSTCGAVYSCFSTDTRHSLSATVQWTASTTSAMACARAPPRSLKAPVVYGGSRLAATRIGGFAAAAHCRVRSLRRAAFAPFSVEVIMRATPKILIAIRIATCVPVVGTRVRRLFGSGALRGCVLGAPVRNTACTKSTQVSRERRQTRYSVRHGIALRRCPASMLL
ncbi:hypothetical protein LMG22931_02091 [Paraburkholderia nemoris]|jgi:hypothetical protein|nr:hypothetical protein LMG22931_02091 [Paraburkholderia nemoris]